MQGLKHVCIANYPGVLTRFKFLEKEFLLAFKTNTKLGNR